MILQATYVLFTKGKTNNIESPRLPVGIVGLG